MANFVKTITNAITVFGGEKTTRWNSMVWGTDKWGYGSYDGIQLVVKVIGNALLASNTLSRLQVGYNRTITNSVRLSADMVSEELLDAAGYKFLFGQSANAENRPMTSYNETNPNSTSFTTQTNSSTSWVEQ